MRNNPNLIPKSKSFGRRDAAVLSPGINLDRIEDPIKFQSCLITLVINR